MQLIIGTPEILERPDSYDYHPQAGWALSGCQGNRCSPLTEASLGFLTWAVAPPKFFLHPNSSSGGPGEHMATRRLLVGASLLPLPR